jgi:periplasmic divalent cation tolerance protein
VLLVFVTAPSRREAEKIGRTVVEEKLAACVNIIPAVSSIFRWQGKVQKNREALLLLKTTGERYRSLEKAIRSKHSYQVPEILAVRVQSGFKQYIEWISKETTTN